MREVVGDKKLNEFVSSSLLHLRSMRKPHVPVQPQTSYDVDYGSLHLQHVNNTNDVNNSDNEIEFLSSRHNAQITSTLQSYHQDLHSNLLDCTRINNELTRTTPHFVGCNALNLSTQHSLNGHSNTRMNYPSTTTTAANVGVNPPELDAVAHVNRMKDERTENTSDFMPDVKIEKTFSLLVCNWTKLKLDLTFVPGTPEHECEKHG